ncbi:acyl-CoA--6-aminopenicillanic acid acyltransferase [Leptospira borgpetersenii]|uniref:acyl-CoA--6-aminopenicillanic acid acyltransferase n=1 Tax=Leptospira borgpetersenii TaxID=174 RepID=UPI0003480C46|nr:acyl-CoA--6-aminopenicillanic acid acyltransferase [Leptospira borgpetersenii]URD69222.1 acyl-CoA--6-aminopenicillanic acid acyltransferase [Leptospira borgpetersenii]UVD72398.1 acyl-CoA--6-aminopenicillanic acid acyltransferase [Leptospira borgpetersenii]UVD75588.1 acyl-CoA--6-aminopenicillanic acid acyltransferase [Leptospira borgpetersenii]UZW32147.1 acyl-CoA--6-aminopenicillanic acid acyltransferase [Leptospira borgpetersenii]
MCDTFVATPSFTGTGSMIFGKNSDREPNEAQALLRVLPRLREAETLCTYIQIPGIKQTQEVILSKPFQMWGAEMGANASGVVIGNEAVFTKIPFEKKNQGLTGMDLLRLALERSKDAETARDTILQLLERFGQDACGGYMNSSFYYHNSFLIADFRNAFVLETAGKFWAWKRIEGFYSISNGLTLEDDYDAIYPKAIEFAFKKNWMKKGETFSFRKAFSDSFFTFFSKCRTRREKIRTMGAFKKGNLDVHAATEILRMEGEPLQTADFYPSSSDMGSVCLHATGPITPNGTTASLVAELKPNLSKNRFWFTGTSIPSISFFLPAGFSGTSFLEKNFEQPGSKLDTSLWWVHEKFYRKIQRFYPDAKRLVQPRIAVLEKEWFRESKKLEKNSNPSKGLDFLSERAVKAALQEYTFWDENLFIELSKNRPRKTFAPFYSLQWSYWNRKAGIIVS